MPFSIILVGCVDTTPILQSFLHWAYADLTVKRGEAFGNRIVWGDIEDGLGRGLEVAQRGRARIQAVGPAVSLARVLSYQGRSSEARSLLGDMLPQPPASSGAPVLNEASAVLAAL